MLDNLLDIEVAYSLLRGGAQDNENDPIDINYEKLKTKIEVGSRRSERCYVKGNLQILQLAVVVPQVVDKSAKEADIILQYVKNTHAATHNTYTLEVQEVSSMAACLFFVCVFVVALTRFFFCFFFLQLLDLQNKARGGAPALPSIRRVAQPAATVARLSHHQLRGYNVSGSPHRPARGSSGEFRNV